FFPGLRYPSATWSSSLSSWGMGCDAFCRYDCHKYSMNTSILIPEKERILGGLWGAVVGDALGVPVEFQGRTALQYSPVTTIKGYGTHNQPPGTWSDDSSLLLCSVDSLNRNEFDTRDMGKRFSDWYDEGLWTPHGNVFD